MDNLDNPKYLCAVILFGTFRKFHLLFADSNMLSYLKFGFD